MENKKTTELLDMLWSEEKKEDIDFIKNYIKPHRIKSRLVTPDDYERMLKDAHILYNLCHTKYGLYNGALAVAHCQITKVDPLAFFVTQDKRIIMNTEFLNHTKTPVSLVEGCMTYGFQPPIKVDRFHKVVVKYLEIDEKGKVTEREENLSSKEAQMFQHEHSHFLARYCYDKNHNPEKSLNKLITS